MDIKTIPASPKNYTKGRPNGGIKGIVVHISQGSLESMGNWFANPIANVSAHYGIGKNGEIHSYVEDADTAWHSGQWQYNINTIGIEHEGLQVQGKPAWQPTAEQYKASVGLSAAICIKYGINPSSKTIFRHSSVNPKKPMCPGPGFPFDNYIQDVSEAVRAHKETESRYIPIRLFDPQTNEQIGIVTLIKGTDKAYLKEWKGR